jgi:hypothetical protein
MLTPTQTASVRSVAAQTLSKVRSGRFRVRSAPKEAPVLHYTKSCTKGLVSVTRGQGKVEIYGNRDKKSVDVEQTCEP